MARIRSVGTRAFSLMELVIVLAIVTVLAGLVVQVLPSLMERSHLAKCAVTIVALNNAWMRSQSLNVRYPDYYDSLLSGGNQGALLTPGLSAGSGNTAVHELTADEAAAFRAVGVTRVFDLDDTATTDATYGGVDYTTARDLSADGAVLELTDAFIAGDGAPLGLKRHLRRNSDGSQTAQPIGTGNPNSVRYIVFGIGPECSGVGSGKLIQEAPVHFGASDQINPMATYQRYLVIFSISYGSSGMPTVRFETAAGNDIAGPSSAGAHIEGFHAATATEG